MNKNFFEKQMLVDGFNEDSLKKLLNPLKQVFNTFQTLHIYTSLVYSHHQVLI